MSKDFRLPRSLRIFEIVTKKEIEPKGTIRKTKGIRNPDLLNDQVWTGMLHCIHQKKDDFAKLGKLLRTNPQDLYYNYGEGPDAADNAIILLREDRSHIIEQNKADAIARGSTPIVERGPLGLEVMLRRMCPEADRSLHAAIVYDLVVNAPKKWEHRKSQTLLLKSELPETSKARLEEFVKLIEIAIATRDKNPIPNPDEDLRKRDEECVQKVRDHAIKILQRDKTTLEMVSKLVDRKDLKEILIKMFDEPSTGTNERSMGFALQNFLSFVHKLESAFSESTIETLMILRDVAICLSLPQDARYAVIQQVLSENHIFNVPTHHLHQGKLYIGFSMGFLASTPKVSKDRLNFISRIHEGEIDVLDHLHAKKIADRQFVACEEPSEGGARKSRFAREFCFGLALALGHSFDPEDSSTPPRCATRVREALKKLKIVEARVCVFLKERPSVVEIKKLRVWLEEIDFVELGSSDFERHEVLEFEIKLVTQKIKVLGVVKQ